MHSEPWSDVTDPIMRIPDQLDQPFRRKCASLVPGIVITDSGQAPHRGGMVGALSNEDAFARRSNRFRQDTSEDLVCHRIWW